MDKIEKLEVTNEFRENVKQKHLLAFVDKLNEVIDYFNQSQKQPEGIIPVVGEVEPMSKKEWTEFCKQMEREESTPERQSKYKVYVSDCCGEEVENIQWVGDEGCARCPDCKEGCGVEELLPEKQEQTKSDVQEWSVRLGTILNDNCIDIIDGDGAGLKSDIEKFISQLLSERTFNKEELEIIEEWADIASEYPDDRKESDLLYEKISKLLKEE